ncbi:MAG: hypothetical protein MSC31_06770 [Solirubrobacteraceae bacterium MAG38_C4-C5]|nr:hypothetical protein [Candidatus Siliceabacter maunaloa]
MRSLSPLAALAFIGRLAFPTIQVALRSGFSVLTAVSTLVLALLDVGIVGALTNPFDA